ncbi:ArsR/SmtB family transcription factor [Anatilimnocola floriformis]|uniref:ArsR/SmtB family transcription factor n=1 Tax=Anatilimnocola floriformis TaxID=2948575 RepID=UPI0020C237A2|nr:metalloregulator ArsR/SmtB family transcription factor [Anatilimnocola floriformis]
MSLTIAQSKRAAPIFAALGDPVRLAFVTRLGRSGPLPTLALQQTTSLTRQAVTKHLQLLEQSGIVHSERAGRERVWELNSKRLTEVRGYLDEISEQWDQALVRLQQFLETE